MSSRGPRPLLAAALLILASPLVLVALIGRLVVGGVLHTLTLLLWLPRGRRVVFVYSESPQWRTHIERDVLTRLPPRSAVLNWSQRSDWPSWSLAVWLFKWHGGRREFNPLGIVIRPLRPALVFRFWPAYQHLKKDRPGFLQVAEAQFFAAVEGAAANRPLLR
jgi:hypothetical protein